MASPNSFLNEPPRNVPDAGECSEQGLSNMIEALQCLQTAGKPEVALEQDHPLHGFASGKYHDDALNCDYALDIGEENTTRSMQDRRVPTKEQFASGRLISLLPGRLSFTAHETEERTAQEIQNNPDLFFFSTDLHERYSAFCRDFGPVNLATLVQFCDYMHEKESDQRLANRHLIYYCTNDTESVSNSAFLLAAYLMLVHGHTPEQAVKAFNSVHGIPILPFRDASFAKSTFHLTVLDCLRGVLKATQLGWFDLDDFDMDEYFDLDSVEHDIHRICPKFIACRGPEEPRLRAADDANDLREEDKDCPVSTPEQAVAMFQELGVKKVIRLNETATYHRRHFLAAGIAHADLFFADCTTPSDQLVARFMAECQTPGLVAVHCHAGLGRTGTMIGLWLMSQHAFSAREAIAWMRIVRPGMVIGPQQNFLEWMEGRIRFGSFPGLFRVLPDRPPPGKGFARRASWQFHVEDASASLSVQLAGKLRRAVMKRCQSRAASE